jgi:CheY-like chemotaxis protein
MNPKRVYVADDEPELLAATLALLNAYGYEAVGAPDGAALLDLVRRRPPDVILLDILMPGPNGWEVQRRLREDTSLGNVPVIAISAQGGKSVEASALNTLGFAAFLRKPFGTEDLFATLEGVLQETRPRDAPPREATTG